MPESTTEQQAPVEIEYGGLTLVYNEGHDERYAHIPQRDRWEYPDEVIQGTKSSGVIFGRIKRTKNAADLEPEDTPRGQDWLMFAKDIPVTRWDWIH
jgi:hypothetical protein